MSTRGPSALRGMRPFAPVHLRYRFSRRGGSSSWRLPAHGRHETLARDVGGELVPQAHEGCDPMGLRFHGCDRRLSVDAILTAMRFTHSRGAIARDSPRGVTGCLISVSFGCLIS